MSGKQFITPAELYHMSMTLAKQVYASDTTKKPTFIVALWRGGTPPAMCIQEYLAWRGIETDHVAVRTSSYISVGIQSHAIDVQGCEYLAEHVTDEDTVLIVDDIFDSGRTLAAVKQKLLSLPKPPRHIYTAVLLYKPTKNVTDMVPDFYVETTDKWVVFPHELDRLTLDEIATHKPDAL